MLPCSRGRGFTAVFLSQGSWCNGDCGNGYEGQRNVHCQAAQFHWSDLQNRGDPAGSAVQDCLRQGSEVGELVLLQRGDRCLIALWAWPLVTLEDPKCGHDHKLSMFIRRKRGTHAQLM